MTPSDYFLPYFNSYFNRNVQFKDLTRYDLTEIYDVDPDKIREFYLKNGDDMHKKAPMRPYVKESVEILKRKYGVFVVTARRESGKYITDSWLKANGIHGVPVYSLGTADKTDMAKELKCDLFVEDHPDESVNLAKNGITVLLMDAPYNRLSRHKNIIRVYDWHDIMKRIEEVLYL